MATNLLFSTFIKTLLRNNTEFFSCIFWVRRSSFSRDTGTFYKMFIVFCFMKFDHCLDSIQWFFRYYINKRIDGFTKALFIILSLMSFRISNILRLFLTYNGPFLFSCAFLKYHDPFLFSCLLLFLNVSCHFDHNAFQKCQPH